MGRHGFILTWNGASSAYIRNDGQVEETITVADATRIPTSKADHVLVGTAWVDTPDVAYTTGYTFRDVLDALQYPSDEYVLLALRLDANFHKLWRSR